MPQYAMITEWNDDKGYGFVTPTEPGSKKIFTHLSACWCEMKVGGRVTYTTEPDDRGGVRAGEIRAAAPLMTPAQKQQLEAQKAGRQVVVGGKAPSLGGKMPVILKELSEPKGRPPGGPPRPRPVRQATDDGDDEDAAPAPSPFAAAPQLTQGQISAGMCSGVVQSWEDDRGYGFINNADGTGWVFAHYSAIIGGNQLIPGNGVMFMTNVGKDGKKSAKNVRGAGVKQGDRSGGLSGGDDYAGYSVPGAANYGQQKKEVRKELTEVEQDPIEDFSEKAYKDTAKALRAVRGKVQQTSELRKKPLSQLDVMQVRKLAQLANLKAEAEYLEGLVTKGRSSQCGVVEGKQAKPEPREETSKQKSTKGAKQESNQEEKAAKQGKGQDAKPKKEKARDGNQEPQKKKQQQQPEKQQKGKARSAAKKTEEARHVPEDHARSPDPEEDEEEAIEEGSEEEEAPEQVSRAVSKPAGKKSTGKKAPTAQTQQPVVSPQTAWPSPMDYPISCVIIIVAMAATMDKVMLAAVVVSVLALYWGWTYANSKPALDDVLPTAGFAPRRGKKKTK